MRDRDVRSALRRQLVREYAEDPGTRIIEEMGVWSGSVRIDMAVINGELSGFELKSNRDTLARLPTQADIYSRVFDKLNLVVGSKHFEKAVDQIPDWWGVIVAADGFESVILTSKREARDNPSLDAYLIAQLLWKTEALEVLGEFNLAGGWRSKRIRSIHERLAYALPLDVLRMHVRQMLKRRTGWLRQEGACQFNVSVDAYANPML